MSLPSLFISHGAPTFALESGDTAHALRAIGERYAYAAGVVILSPHWMTESLTITGALELATIHDFYGFPRELYAIQYPARGSTRLTAWVLDTLRASGFDADTDLSRGLDHGAWVPLRHLFPAAEIPIVQLSLPVRASARDAYALGRSLRPLADEGILVIGSGSLTHNLRDLRADGGPTAAYAREFVDWITAATARGDGDAVVDALERAPHARQAHPTSEHYLPLPFAVGAATSLQPSTRIDGGIRYGALSMDSYVFGA